MRELFACSTPPREYNKPAACFETTYPHYGIHFPTARFVKQGLPPLRAGRIIPPTRPVQMAARLVLDRLPDRPAPAAFYPLRAAEGRENAFKILRDLLIGRRFDFRERPGQAVIQVAQGRIVHRHIDVPPTVDFHPDVGQVAGDPSIRPVGILPRRYFA